MRAFLAIELSESVKESLGRLIRQLQRTGADIRWVKTVNLHLTLEFFGEVPPGTVERIDEAMRTVAARVSSFTVRLGETGAFPNERRPRVFWLGISEGRQNVCALRETIHGVLSVAGIAGDDKPFEPHITLGRVCSSRGTEEALAVLHTVPQEEFGATRVERVTLFRSDLRPEGAVHTPVREFAWRTGRKFALHQTEEGQEHV
ncbi:MAG: 2'-5' RNA ligase [Armatimonadetes bacterium CG2_30_59_28]|nr:RNA 2',3'-cyclic phosphodiesterase [Armatimonadota bacterium]OIO98057.1 MAG: 2'-5' RNA ligase [Armatimonadetes bacterium CG2_30_59_28]PIU67363.1 MAG: RNA 2',3'-cyclic phosphodiesterase [Armatimonadetes bacterium CG07_land_8_20_14_0_80_59_28]PIX40602.1 MAG: RNA 2',3'-cyclic phosphodiesterase [Armatimonadetes bacterium CG_4_8_14_3_um_filter_58_9]